MSKKSEQAALNYLDETTVSVRRKDFKRGYEQAERDLELTWLDVKAIVEIADYLLPHMRIDADDLLAEFQTEQSYYEKVLQLFKESRDDRRESQGSD